MTGYQPTPADIETVANAAATLDAYALTVRHSCSVGPEYVRFPKAEDKVFYASLKVQVGEMYALADRLQIALESAQLKLPLETLG